MRKITKDAYSAFTKKKRFNRDNTQVSVTHGDAHMYLFGNEIAKTEKGCVYISSAGWTTTTTVERLSAFPIRLRINRGDLILNEHYKWNGEWLNISDDDRNNRSEVE